MSLTTPAGEGRIWRRHLGRYVLFGVVAVVVVWGALAALRLVSAAHQISHGVDAAQSIRTELNGDLNGGDLDHGAASSRLAAAASDFANAHRSVNSVWVAPLRVLPYVGRQVRAVDDLSGAAATVSRSGQTALTQVAATLARPQRTAADRQAAIGQLAHTLTALDRAVDDVDLGPSKNLWPAVANRRNTFVTELTALRSGLDKGAGAAAAVADLLDNHRRYLILTANNAEMRAGQGMYLQVGTITSSGGRLTLGSFAPTSNLVTARSPVEVGGDLLARWGSLGLGNDYRKLGFSPQYPLNAPVAAAMWKAAGGAPVDGVITVDVGALKDLLAVTGPVTGGKLNVSAADVEQTLFVDQYVGVDSDATNDARREALGVLAAAVFDRAQTQGLSISSLTRALDQAVDGRHLMAWSRNPEVEKDWTAAGAGGALPTDGLLVGVSNTGGNKLDPYLATQAQLTTRAEGSKTLVTVTATLTNHAPTGLPGYVAGTPAGDYQGVATLDLPKYAGDVTATGGGVVAHGADGSSNVVAMAVKVPRGHSATVTWTFRLLGRHGDLAVEPSARMPGISWSAGSQKSGMQTFTDSEAHTVSW